MAWLCSWVCSPAESLRYWSPAWCGRPVAVQSTGWGCAGFLSTLQQAREGRVPLRADPSSAGARGLPGSGSRVPRGSSVSHTCRGWLLWSPGLAGWAGSNFGKWVCHQGGGVCCSSALFRRMCP